MNRVCPNCFRKEETRYNFGSNKEAEKIFHAEKWCKCNYDSPQEMMLDQDMGFTDPHWIIIAKYFLKNYHDALESGTLESKEEIVRFFLKTLKNSANNIWKSIELVEMKEDEGFQGIYDGKPKTKPKSYIF